MGDHYTSRCPECRFPRDQHHRTCSKVHKDLVGLSDRDLRLRAGDATHQHYKGGLYRLIGPVKDSMTGEPLKYRASGEEVLIYEHVYPHPRELWARSVKEFNEVLPDGTPRFRKLS